MRPRFRYSQRVAIPRLTTLADRPQRFGQKIRDIDLQGRSNSQQGVQIGLSHPPFDITHHLLGKPGALSHGIHGGMLPQTFLSQQGGNPRSNGVKVFLVEHTSRKRDNRFDSASHVCENSNV